MFRLKGKARDLALRAGGLKLMRELGRNSVRMLLYHRFPVAYRENLARQCAHLCRHYHVVTLQEVDHWLHEGMALPANSLVVTVDDGHHDFFRVAYPVFREYQIPVTMFLATGFLDRACWLWGDRVMYMFRQTARKSVEVALPAEEQRYSLESPDLRREAARTVKEAAKRMEDERRLKLVYDELPRLLNVTVPENPPEEYEPLLWDEVREMTRNGMTFGAHTKTHPILSSIVSAAKRREEIEVSKRRIEDELALPVAHFSYPNGTSRDINAETIQIVRDAGFKSAVVAEPGLNSRTSDPFLLRRTTVEPESPVLSFDRDITRSLRS
jgi:peptidoglycan/xylan/chitin deacetylase (PgdA/CDA1 family)